MNIYFTDIGMKSFHKNKQVDDYPPCLQIEPSSYATLDVYFVLRQTKLLQRKKMVLWVQ